MFPMTVNGQMPFTPNYSNSNDNSCVTSKSSRMDDNINKDADGNFKSFHVKLKTFFQSKKRIRKIKSRFLKKDETDVKIEVDDLLDEEQENNFIINNHHFSSAPQFSPLSVIVEEEEDSNKSSLKHNYHSSTYRHQHHCEVKLSSIHKPSVKVISPSNWKTDILNSASHNATNSNDISTYETSNNSEKSGAICLSNTSLSSTGSA